MKFSRRQFMQGGIAAFTVSFATSDWVSQLVQAQGAHTRNLVVLYLSGGNDSLSTLAPYNDPFYYSRRPTLAIPAANVLQVGTDASGNALGLHPRLAGLRSIFDAGRLAMIQRCGYPNQSRSHFLGLDIWSTATAANTQGPGWVGRYLDTIANPDSLVGWNTTGNAPHVLEADHTPVPSIANPSTYAFASPNSGTEASLERAATQRVINSHVPVNVPHLAFVYKSAQAAYGTLDRVASVASYVPSTTYPNNGFAQALRAVAGSMARGIGTKVFYVTTGGYDTHSGQNVNGTNGAYANLMGTLDGGLTAFYNDLSNQGLINDTLVLIFSEFGRRVSENGSQGTDHGSASVMMALGGQVHGGLYGTAPSLNTATSNPTLENNAGDVRMETDFRSVYARVLDNWLGANSVSILGADYRKASLTFV